MKFSILVSILLFSYSNCFSQSILSGRVFEKDSEIPIPFAEITLSIGDKFYKATVADADGSYEINNIEENEYALSLKYLGFKTYKETLVFSQIQKINKNIVLVPITQKLEEVTITAKKTTIKFLADKRVINVGDDLISSGADTEDVLRQIPSVDVDLSGNVSLLNNTSVILMIDGKRSPLSSADVIAQIPSNLIDKIEVITNPSAKYSAEGISGIINIIINKSELRGGNINISAGLGQNGRGNITTNGNYRNNKVNFFTNYNFRKNYFTSEFETERMDGSSHIKQNGFSKFDEATVKYIKVGTDFFIDSTQTITPSIIINKNKHTLFNQTKSVSSSDGGNNTIDFASKNKHSHITREGNLNYRKEFNGGNHFFKFDANLALYPNTFNLNLEQEESIGQEFTINDNQSSNNLITTLSGDYYRSKNNGSIYEFGVKYEYRNLDNFQDRIISTNTSDIRAIDNFVYKDQVLALYGVYEYRHNKFSLKPGLRLEQYNINLGNDTSLNFENNYLNLFPSFSASYYFEKSSFTTSYTRRISRPDAFVLNPFIIELGNFERRKGNPYLKPSFADKVELNFNQKFSKNSLNVTIFYTKSNEVIQSISEKEGNFIIRSFENVGISRQFGGEAFLKFVVFNWWDTNLSFNYYFSKFETDNYKNNTTLSQSYSIRNSFKVLRSWSAQLNVNINPKRQTLQQTIQTLYWLDLSISTKLFKGKGEATLTVNDLINTQKFEFNRSVANLTQTTLRKPQSQFVYFTFRHRFSFGKDDFENRKRRNREYSDGNVN